MMVSRSLAVAGILAITIAGSARADVKTWRVGTGGESWEAWVEKSSAVDFGSVSGTIQPREARARDNLTLRLKWSDGAPVDFTAEGNARIWDNSAVFASDLVLVDGDSSSSTGDRFKAVGGNQIGRSVFMDLGEPYFLNRIVFYPRQSGFATDAKGERHYYRDDFLGGYEVFIADGAQFTPAGQPVYKLLKADRRNRSSMVAVNFTPQLLRFIRLRATAPDAFELAEIEVYGTGFSKASQYVSKVIDLGSAGKEAVNLGKLEWGQTAWRRFEDRLIPFSGGGVVARVETRTGKDDTPDRYFALTDSGEVAIGKGAFDALAADKRVLKIDEDNWSLWSAPVLAPGEQIGSPSPRRYLQFRVTLSGSTTEMVRMAYLSFMYSTPLPATRVVGEVALAAEPRPAGRVAVVEAGKREVFTYDVKTEFGSARQTGFDGLRISVPPRTSFRGLEIGAPLASTRPARVDSSDARYITVYLSSGDRITPLHAVPVRVTLEAAVLAYGTEFEGAVFNTGSGDLPQSLEAGDASPDVETNSLRVLLFERSIGRVLSAFDVSPSIITPNGDGVNDQALISYTVSQLIGRVSAAVVIYDLAGCVVKRLPVAPTGSGVYDVRWDGLDGVGARVQPGVYACELALEANSETFRGLRTIHVVY